MKKIKIAAFILFLLVLILGAVTYYLNTHYLPHKLKIQIERTLSEKLKADVALDDIRFHPLKGIILENFRIAEKKGAAPILRVKKLSASVLLLPSFKEKKIIFPLIHIDNASLSLARTKDGTINLLRFLPQEKTQPNTKLPFPFLVYKILLTNSSIHFVDESLETPLSQTLEVKTLSAQPGPASVNARMQATLRNQNQSTPVECTLKYTYAIKQVDANITLKRLDLLPYLLYAKNLPVQIKALSLDTIVVNAEYSLIKKRVDIETRATIANAYCIKDNYLLANGRGILQASASINTEEKTMTCYQAQLRSASAQIQTPFLPEHIALTDTKLNISPDTITVDSARVTALNTSLVCKGTMEQFAAPIFSFQVFSDFSLATAKEIASRYVKTIAAISLDGRASLAAEIKKETDKETIDYRGSLELFDASAAHKNLAADRINGTVLFSPESVSWKNLSLYALNRSINSSATIQNFSLPSLAITAASDDITLDARVASLQKNVFAVEKLSLCFMQSSFDADGKFSLESPDEPFADFNINANINLEDLSAVDQIPQVTLAQLKPGGTCNISGKIKGNPKKPIYLDSSLLFNSQELRLQNLKLHSITVELIQEDGQLKIPQSSASFYNGTLALNGLIDLHKTNLPYAFKLIAEGIDLALLKLDTPLKENELKGTFSAAAVANGEARSLTSMQGQGNILIENGHLWAFRPLNKLKDFLFIPRFQTLVFNKAQGDFTIQEGRAYTDDFVLTSNEITLDCEGSIGFDKTIDFEITPIPAEELSQKIFSNDFLKVAGLAAVRLTGTIENPQIGTKVLTKEALKAIGENAGKILGEVFETFKDWGDKIFGTPQ